MLGEKSYKKALSSYGVEPGVDGYVLVLGSGGLVGKSLVRYLRAQGYSVIEVKNRQHLDLRDEGALDIFAHLHIRFCFFLAAEVGGSKFLTQGGDADKAIWDSNIAMYDVVFPFLAQHQIRFVFASSQLSTQPTPYGRVKKQGEERIAELNSKQASRNQPPLGKIVKFWNIVGQEFVGSRSHVIPDVALQCARSGTARLLTDGNELRQYLSTDDCSRGLIAMMEQFSTIPSETHLTHGQFSSLKDVAVAMDKATPGGCKVSFGEKPSTMARSGDPDLVTHGTPQGWKPFRQLSDMVERVVDFYLRLSPQGPSFYKPQCKPYVSVVLSGRNDGYSAGYVTRVQNYVTALARFAHRFQLCLEFILVEFGAEPGKQLVFELIQWPRDGLYGGARSIIVPPEVANRPFNHENIERYLPQDEWAMFKNYGPMVYEYVAKNIGARRARGEYILIGNADSLLGPEVVEFIAKRQLEKDFLYRVQRRNMPATMPRDGIDVEQLIQWSLVNSGFEDTKFFRATPRLRYVNRPGNEERDIYSYNSGDFTLIHADLFEKSGGFPEAPFNTHVDTIFVMKLWAMPIAPWQSIIEGYMHHQNHDQKTTYSRPIPHWSLVFKARDAMMCLGPQLYTDVNWGMVTETFEEKWA